MQAIIEKKMIEKDQDQDDPDVGIIKQGLKHSY